MKRNTGWILAAAVSLAAIAACGKSQSGGAGSGGDQVTGPMGAVDTAQAKEIFDARCAACHGPDGRGNGPGATALTPKPRNYHDKTWQTKVSDDDIRKTITYGGAAVGKSPMMPANPDLESKPQVVDGLVRIVRGFGKSS